MPVIVDGDNGRASVDLSSQQENIFNGGTASVTIPSISGIDKYSVLIPVSHLSTTGTPGSLKLNTKNGNITVPSNMLAGVTEDANSSDNFSDAGSTYYTGFLAAAKKLGISSGVGSNMFAPDKEITRQEMFTMLYKALKVIDRLPEGNSGRSLSDFNDSEIVESWAEEAMTLMVETGNISGSAGKISPQGITSRAEMAQVLYNLLSK